MADSFYRTIIEEDRYVLLTKGLKTTLIISFCSIIFGTLLGILLCYLRRSNNKVISTITKIYVNIMRGIPITLLLLGFYYVIFQDINIEPEIVGVIVFSVYFSVYISEVLKGALDSINKSQIDSAYSLGFTKYQTIKYVIVPQSLPNIIPNFKNEALSLIKLTSIVGYISVMDITKASDIIRNRTYEAFAPLIVAAIFYELLCLLVSFILDFLYKKINKKYYDRGEKHVRAY